MKKTILKSIVVFLFCFGAILPSFADDEGGKTLDFQKKGALNNNYDNVFQSDWFFKPENKDSITAIRKLFYEGILPKFKYLFLFLGIITWAVYITIMISSVGAEDKINEQKKAMLSGIIGFFVVSLAVEFGRVLTPLRHQEEIIDVAGTQTMIQKIIALLQIGVGIVALIMIFYSAVQFIRSEGEDEEISEAKKRLRWGIMGIVLVILSEPLVNRVFFPADKSLGIDNTDAFTEELGGFLKFFLTFLAAIAFVALIIAGFYFVTSFGEEERQTAAKSIIVGTLLGLLVIALSFVLVVTLVPGA